MSKEFKYEVREEDIAKRVPNKHGSPAMRVNDPNESDEKKKKKMEILRKLTELESRRGIAKFDSVEEMQILIENYFQDCVDLELRPTIRGLASALGTVYNTLNDWERGSRDAQLGSGCSVLIKKSKQFISEYDELLALENIDNPVLFMFRAKNYYGMKDTQDIQISPNTPLGDQLTPEEIAKRLPQDIPVDVDCIE
ncbi:MAG: hypothetical protein E6600_04445 [Anaerocolumna aminovalerica]|uniref:terminase small subunit n=1 Tax=Anaerocolumna aminovalerica TaxID=1527 RepID=UPI002915BC71|nr:terminase small subunit [Anaerocolumna aminovalerica]MDU6263731.1 hypothetical protein [Anaerocolumna aminovalerica]